MTEPHTPPLKWTTDPTEDRFDPGVIDPPFIEAFSEPADGGVDADADEPTDDDAPDEVVIVAKRKLTLKVGKASITLHGNGKIALRGLYIVSEADGTNRIVGGQIEIN